MKRSEEETPAESVGVLSSQVSGQDQNSDDDVCQDIYRARDDPNDSADIAGGLTVAPSLLSSPKRHDAARQRNKRHQ